MRAVVVQGGTGSADALQIQTGIPEPQAKNDKVVVRVKAFGLNRMDIMQREGVYPLKFSEDGGSILGVEFSGVVEEKGPDCTNEYKPGDRVFGLVYGSAYAEKVAIREKMLIRIPATMSFETAAAIPETYYTAIQAVLYVGKLTKGETILIHAGASGVGISAIQIAKLSGASKIFTTVSTDEKCNFCKSHGADVAINYKKDDFAEVIAKETNGQGVNVIVDLVGKDYWHRNVESAAMEGRMVIVSTVSGNIVDGFNIGALMKKTMSVLTTTLRNRSTEYQNGLRDFFVERCLDAFDNGELKVPIDEVFPWTKVADAHRKMEGNKNMGKIVCTVE